ncbi:MAG: large subunit ribosomal protein L32e [Candidatus Woesearchaeota archaeon]|nr:large subunit ribosomal protein L32e [Candidatus Woesearchaeota archaeon]MDN5327993.1 large subunit ribosomal protein L32e [Candidatus Woesearchaeota archaeon]
MTIQDKLVLRKIIKRKKPDYKNSGSWRRIHKFGSWRRPKGHQSKMRLKKRGYPRVVEVGYGSPRDVKGMHPKGLFPVTVYSVKDLANIDSKTQGIVIASSVGLLKKKLIFDEAVKKKITVLNLSKEKLESLLKERELSKEQREKEKEEKKQKIKKSLEEAVKESEEKTEENKEEKKKEAKEMSEEKKGTDKAEETKTEKEKLKEEYDKILTKPQN